MAKVITKAVEQFATSDLVEHVAENSEYTKVAIKKIVDDFLAVTLSKVVEGHTVVLKGIGRFTTSTRPARTGRNPMTGESIEIGPTNVVKFKPSVGVKKAANSKK